MGLNSKYCDSLRGRGGTTSSRKRRNRVIGALQLLEDRQLLAVTYHFKGVVSSLGELDVDPDVAWGQWPQGVTEGALVTGSFAVEGDSLRDLEFTVGQAHVEVPSGESLILDTPAGDAIVYYGDASPVATVNSDARIAGLEFSGIDDVFDGSHLPSIRLTDWDSAILSWQAAEYSYHYPCDDAFLDFRCPSHHEAVMDATITELTEIIDRDLDAASGSITYQTERVAADDSLRIDFKASGVQ